MSMFDLIMGAANPNLSPCFGLVQSKVNVIVMIHNDNIIVCFDELTSRIPFCASI